jgi:hypothetical protein
MKSFRIAFTAGILAVAMGSIAPAHSSDEGSKPAHVAAKAPGSHGFDFLFGEWRVRHRRVQADTHKWVEFDGTCSALEHKRRTR